MSQAPSQPPRKRIAELVGTMHETYPTRIPSLIPAHNLPHLKRRKGAAPRLPTLLVGAILLAIPEASVHAQNTPNQALQIANFVYPDESRLLFPNETVGTFRSNFCDASYRALVTGEISLDKALVGREIRTAMLSSGDLATYDFDDNGNVIGLNPDYPGLMPLILDELCERAGCTWRDTFAYVPKTFPNNETFSDLLRWTTDVYDISINFWSRSIARLEDGATFIESWYDGSIIMIQVQTPPGEDSFDPWGWLAPFDYAVWFLILMTIFVSTLVHWMIEVVFKIDDPHGIEFSVHEDDEQTTLWEKLEPWETMWRFATAFAGQFEFEPTTGPGFLFSFSVAFWALLMGAAYTANLASFLVIRAQAGIPAATIEEAVQRDTRMCVNKGSQQDLSVTASFPVFAQNGRLIRISGGGDRKVLESLKAGLCDIGITEAAAWNIFQRDENLNGDCNLEWVGRPLFSIPASFSVKSDAGSLCTSFLRDVFNVHLIRMEIEGIIDRLWEEHLDRTATVDCDASAADPQQRRLETNLDQREIQGTQSSYDRASFGRILKAAGSLSRGAAAGGAAASSSSTDGTTKLSLTNMGGVFLLHALLSGIALFFAAFSWAWRRGHLGEIFGEACHPRHLREEDAVPATLFTHKSGTEQSGIAHFLSFHYHDKHDARRCEVKSAEEAGVSHPCSDHHHPAREHHYHNKHHLRTDNKHHDHSRKHKRTDSLKALREEMSNQLNTVEEHLRDRMDDQFSIVEERLTERLKRIEEVLLTPLEKLHEQQFATVQAAEQHRFQPPQPNARQPPTQLALPPLPNIEQSSSSDNQSLNFSGLSNEEIVYEEIVFDDFSKTNYVLPVEDDEIATVSSTLAGI